MSRLASFLCAAGLCLAAAGPASAFTIDNFTDGRLTLETPAMTPSADGWLRADTAASVPGGWRSLALQSLAGSTSLAFIGLDTLGLEAYRVQNQQLYVSFGYGQTAPMNLDLSGQAALRLDVAWGGAMTAAGPWDNNALTLTVYATTSNGAGLNPNGSAARAVLHGGGVLDLPLADFGINSGTGLGVDWSDVDGLLFVVNESIVGAQSAGFGIRSLSTVSAVPEPSSWALGAVGLAALALRRGRSRRRAALAGAALLACGAASAGDIVNIPGAGASGAGANIFSYPVAPGTLVDLFNPVLVPLPAGTYTLVDAWGLAGATYDTWNFEQSAPGSWASHYVAAEVLGSGGYRLLVDGVSLLDPSCHNHFCAWDTQAQAAAAFLATPAYTFTLAQPATVAFASADYFLPDNLGGISLLITAVPEPGPWALLAGGLLALCGRLRRQPVGG
jgi:PEP-CTERM motif